MNVRWTTDVRQPARETARIIAAESHYNARTTAACRTSDHLWPPDDRLCPEIRRKPTKEGTSEARLPPDVWTPASDQTYGNHRTSDPSCAQPLRFPPMYSSHPVGYIYITSLRSITVSKGLAQDRDRSFLIATS